VYFAFRKSLCILPQLLSKINRFQSKKLRNTDFFTDFFGCIIQKQQKQRLLSENAVFGLIFSFAHNREVFW
jgi:hypothetical protein